MQKSLQEALEQENVNQLNFPFILDKKKYSPIPHILSDIEHDLKTLHQKDFLTHKINHIIN